MVVPPFPALFAGSPDHSLGDLSPFFHATVFDKPDQLPERIKKIEIKLICM